MTSQLSEIQPNERRIVPESEFKEADEPEEIITIEDSGDDDIDIVPSTDDVNDIVPSADDIHEIKLNNKPKKRKTEVEKLRIESWNPSSGKRSRSQSNFPLLCQPNRQVGRVSIPHPPP